MLGMRGSTDRILVTQIGSLPRPTGLLERSTRKIGEPGSASQQRRRRGPSDRNSASTSSVTVSSESRVF